MTAEEYYKKNRIWQPKDKHDKTLKIFDWNDILDFAEQYTKKEKDHVLKQVKEDVEDRCIVDCKPYIRLEVAQELISKYISE